MIRILSTFTTDDSHLKGVLLWVNGMADDDPAKHEALAQLHMMLARSHWQSSDRIQRHQATERNLAARREKRAAAKAAASDTPT